MSFFHLFTEEVHVISNIEFLVNARISKNEPNTLIKLEEVEREINDKIKHAMNFYIIFQENTLIVKELSIVSSAILLLMLT